MKTQEIEVKSNLRILMQTDNQSLDEVVVVAYGTAKKESFTGSAEIIKNEKIEKRTVANVSKALDGLVAGVQTTSGSGQPGSGSSVVIRGFGSIKASQNPLYVVDGIPYDGNSNQSKRYRVDDCIEGCICRCVVWISWCKRGCDDYN